MKLKKEKVVEVEKLIRFSFLILKKCQHNLKFLDPDAAARCMCIRMQHEDNNTNISPLA